LERHVGEYRRREDLRDRADLEQGPLSRRTATRGCFAEEADLSPLALAHAAHQRRVAPCVCRQDVVDRRHVPHRRVHACLLAFYEQGCMTVPVPEPVTVTELSQQTTAVLRRVKAGRSLPITERGRAVAGGHGPAGCACRAGCGGSSRCAVSRPATSTP